MVEEVVKTLEATLAPPTAWKEERLEAIVSTYREALDEAFNAGASTMSAVNDIVTPYDMPTYAKDALKRHVPKLHRNYGAEWLDDDQPVRFVYRAAVFDRDTSRHHEICWSVPQVGRGTNFWIPLRINPEQKPHWDDLVSGGIYPGEIRLQKNRGSWKLHVTTHHEIETGEIEGEHTPVGFDIGESTLITGCALNRGDPVKPMLESGSRARKLRKELHTTLQRLQEREASEWRIEERSEFYQNILGDIVEKVSRRAVEYAKSFHNPVIALEDLGFDFDRVDYGKHMNRRLHSWAFAMIQDRIVDKATESGIPVRMVRPEYTSKICHACKKIGERDRQAEFRCENSNCHITEFQADINAAANIAGRVDPWGESVPWKPGRNDSPRDGSGSDTATTH